jgi:DNA-binding LacI/PurR family transcriptional regulator
VSHVKQDEKTIARRAYAMLRTMMNGEKPEEYRQLIETKIIRGETTAPPRES